MSLKCQRGVRTTELTALRGETHPRPKLSSEQARLIEEASSSSSAREIWKLAGQPLDDATETRLAVAHPHLLRGEPQQAAHSG